MPDMLDLLIRPRGAIITRDGRPFSATPGARAVSLPWPLPGTLAGAVRTYIGNDLGLDWRDASSPARAMAIQVGGPLAVTRRAADAPWEVCVPAPRDALITGDTAPYLLSWLRPVAAALPAGAGCDLPAKGLRPLQIDDQAKAAEGFAWWTLDAVTQWLTNPAAVTQPPRRIAQLPREHRMHVSVDPARGTAREGALFATEGRFFADAPTAEHDERALLGRVVLGGEAWSPSGSAFITFGGERRVAVVEPSPGLWPTIPSALQAALRGVPRLRLLLATPACFAGGWRPGWIDPATLEGTPPGSQGLRLRLEAAAVGRREAVSGWDLAQKRPRAARWLVPAGSVYFFTMLDGTDPATADTAQLWLRSIADEAQDRRDGYGLALPGVW